jgi:cytochrome c553
MKLVIPFICSLLLLGCSESQQTEKSPASDTAPSVEMNQTTTTEANASSTLPTTQSTASVTETAGTDAGALFGQKCGSCHGAKAEKSALNKSQIIANFSEAQVKEALKGYQNGTYGKEMKGVMQGQVKGLSDAQIDALAKYISGL